MKRVLFVADSLSVGGLEKSLINLLKFFDHERYQVDLYLFNDGRDLLPELHEKVNLLPQSPCFHDFYCESIGKSVKKLACRGKLGLCFWRILRMIKPRFFKLVHRPYNPDTPLDWHIKKKTMLKCQTHYDVAIGFAEGSANHYVADCVDATVKLGWVHTDVSHTAINLKQERRMLSRLDNLVTVSENSKRALVHFFPDLEERMVVLPNLMDTQQIDLLSEQTPDGMDLGENCLKIVSVGRLVELKGFHLCPAVCRKLLDAGARVHWYVIGEGEYRAAIEREIEKHGVASSFTLLGNCSNPYCYERAADICVQPSSYEGKSVVIEEEKYLRKPIVVTDIGAFCEVIQHGVTGLIAARDPEALFLAAQELCESEQLRQSISNNLQNEFTPNAVILNRIYALMEQK